MRIDGTSPKQTDARAMVATKQNLDGVQMGEKTMSAAGVTVCTASFLGAGAGSSPSAALHDLEVRPIPVVVARKLLELRHYLHSLPGGTLLCFGLFAGPRLAGALTVGAGPALAYHLVEGATRDDCATLTRLWLSDELPHNSESRAISIVLRALRRHTALKFLVTYADPAAGHLGIIYQATNWLYSGLSEAMSMIDLGDGRVRHSRSVGQVFGTHSTEYLTRRGLQVRLVSQVAKHRYVYFLDPEWRNRLRVPVLSYPERGATHGDR